MSAHVRNGLAVGILVGLTCLIGCSGQVAKAVVEGEVTLNGKPLKEGMIRFEPIDGQTAAEDAPITDGRFSATVPVGEKRVKITAPKVVRKHRMMPDSPEVDIVDELLPERYNVKTTLTMTVQAGTQSKSFPLESKEK